MFWYLQALRKYADFSGRARRREYWLFTLVNLVITFVLSIPYILDLGEGPILLLSLVTFVYGLAVLVPGLAVCVRRLHDTNHSGWWYLIGLLPFIGGIVLLVWFVKDSDPGENNYGPSPKYMVEGSTSVGNLKGRVFVIAGVVLAAAAFITWGITAVANKATTEARALAPWPREGVSAEQVARFDLSPIGLQAVGVRDARAIYGETFADGSVIEYAADGNLVAIVAALRYPSQDVAGSEFSNIASWAEENCGRYVTGTYWGAGALHCDFADSHDMILWSDNWILDIEVGAPGQASPAELADRISAAAAAHWHTLAGG